MGKQRSWPLTQPTYGVAIHWDQLAKNVDLDLQAVIVDDSGVIVDAVYYNNLLAMNGAVGLSGDDLGDESIWIRLNKLPSKVRLLIFVVAAYSGGHLRDVTNGRIVVLERQAAVTIKFKEFKMERSRSDADLVAMFKRFKDDTWGLVELDEPAEKGSHFLDILEPTIGDLIRSEIPLAPKYQKVAFVMDKGAVADFPQAAALRRLIVGVGGTLACDEDEDVHVELSAVFYNAKGEQVGMVDGESKGMYGVERSSDSTAGGHLGNDETLTIDLAQIPGEVMQVFLVLLVIDGTFKAVEHAHARVVDQALSELVRYDIEAGHNESGLVIARLLRSSDQRWGIQTVGKFFRISYMTEELNLLFADQPNNSKNARKAALKGGKEGKSNAQQVNRRGVMVYGSGEGRTSGASEVEPAEGAEDHASKPESKAAAESGKGGESTASPRLTSAETGGSPRLGSPRTANAATPAADAGKQSKKGRKAFVPARRRTAHLSGSNGEDTDPSEGSARPNAAREGLATERQVDGPTSGGKAIQVSLGEAVPTIPGKVAGVERREVAERREATETAKVAAELDSSDQVPFMEGGDAEISKGLQVCRDCAPFSLRRLFEKKNSGDAV